jgi:hypothetical protein
VTVDGLADENGTDYTVNATGNASVVVEPGPPEEPPGLEKARTLDGDGTYDDLDGDSRTTVIDVATMLEERNTIDRMPENARLGSEKNGDGGFSVVDVAAFRGRPTAPAGATVRTRTGPRSCRLRHRSGRPRSVVDRAGRRRGRGPVPVPVPALALTLPPIGR